MGLSEDTNLSERTDLGDVERIRLNFSTSWADGADAVPEHF